MSKYSLIAYIGLGIETLGAGATFFPEKIADYINPLETQAFSEGNYSYQLMPVKNSATDYVLYVSEALILIGAGVAWKALDRRENKK